MDTNLSASLQTIAVFHTMPNMDSLPCVKILIELLASRGYRIDVFTTVDSIHIRPKFKSSNIRLVGDVYRSRTRKLHDWKWLEHLHLSMLGLRWQRKAQYKCVIGVDPEGLIQASAFNRFIRLSLIYYSTELLLSYELKQKPLLKLKKSETTLVQRCSAVVIQDTVRAELLRRDCRVMSNIEMLLIPNGPLPKIRARKGNYLRAKYRLKEEDVIILHSGSLGSWTCIQELIASVELWDKAWVLVIHFRYHCDVKVLDNLKKLAMGKRIVISSEPCESSEYDALVDSADIGVAFYRATYESRYTGDNVRYLGLSSGKVGYFLRAGLPFVTNDRESLKALAEDNGCGVYIEREDLAGIAINRILSDYQVFSQNAVNTYRSCYNPVAGMNSAIDFIERIKA